MWRRQGLRRYVYIRVAFLIVVLVAVLALHASGTTLVVLRVARIALVGLLVLGGGALARRRGRASIGRGPGQPRGAAGRGAAEDQAARDGEAARGSRS